MNCAEFQERLAEMLSESDPHMDEHLASCENCTALLRDLEYIRDMAKLLLPIHDPSPKVWEGINAAMRQEAGSATKGKPDSGKRR